MYVKVDIKDFTVANGPEDVKVVSITKKGMASILRQLADLSGFHHCATISMSDYVYGDWLGNAPYIILNSKPRSRPEIEWNQHVVHSFVREGHKEDCKHKKAVITICDCEVKTTTLTHTVFAEPEGYDGNYTPVLKSMQRDASFEDELWRGNKALKKSNTALAEENKQLREELRAVKKERNTLRAKVRKGAKA